MGRVMEIHGHLAANGSAEKTIDRDAHSFAGDVPQRDVDAAHRGKPRTAHAALEDPVPEVHVDPLDGQRIATLETLAEIMVDDFGRADFIYHFARAGNSLVGIDTHEAVAHLPQSRRLDVGDLELGHTTGAGRPGVLRHGRVSANCG